MATVHSLRNSGHKVRVNHNRRYFDPVNKRWAFLTKHDRSISELPDYIVVDVAGVYTEIAVTPKDSETTFTALSECSKKDAYNRKRGVSIAIGRIIQLAEADGINLYDLNVTSDNIQVVEAGLHVEPIKT